MRRTVAEEAGSDALVDGDERRVRGVLAGERDTWAGDVVERLGDRVDKALGDRVVVRLGETCRGSTRLGVRIGLRVT